MKFFSLPVLFAFLTFSLVVNCVTYQGYQKRVTVPPGISLSMNASFPCSNNGVYCVSVHTTTKNDFEFYSFDTLDGTTAKTNEAYTVHIQTYDIQLYSNQLFATQTLSVLLTCTGGVGQEPDQSQGWAVVFLQKGSASFTAYNGAKGRFGAEKAGLDGFEEKGSSQIDNQVNVFCPGIPN